MSSNSNASELGLVALIIGAAQFVSSPVILILATLTWRFADQASNVVLLHAWLARIGSAIIATTAVAGIVFGGKAVLEARRSNVSCGFAYAGLLMASLGAIAAGIAILGLLNTTESMLILFG